MLICDLILLAACIFFVAADIILALCVGYTLPLHVTDFGWYPANDAELQYYDAIEICPCLSKIFPSGTKNPIKFSKITYKVSKRSINNVDLFLKRYSYLVSLSFLNYTDDVPQYVFGCNGLVLSQNWLLTFKSCTEKEKDWDNWIVRSESLYWSSNGTEHTINDVQETNDTNLVKLEIFPPFSDKIIPYPQIKYSFTSKWTYAVSLGWDDNMENNLFSLEEWVSVVTTTTSKEICFDKDNSPKKPGKFLLNSCHQLIGFESHENVCDGFFAVSNYIESDFPNEKNLMIYSDNHDLKEPEICET